MLYFQSNERELKTKQKLIYIQKESPILRTFPLNHDVSDSIIFKRQLDTKKLSFP